MKTKLKSIIAGALCAVGLGVLPATAEEVSQTFADMGLENATTPDIIDLGDVEMSFDKDDSTPSKYYTSGLAVTYKNTAVEDVLPTGYTKLIAIKSTGLQYIDTEYVHTSSTRIDCEFCADKGKGRYSAIFGSCKSGWQSNAFFFGSIWNDDKTCYCRSGNQAFGDYITFGERISLTCEGDTAVWNGQTITTTGNLDGGVNTMFIFAYNNANGSGKSAKEFCTMQLYSFKISEEGTPVRDYVPCINDKGEIGLYDLVGGKFYGNKGSGRGFVAVYPPNTVTLDAQGGNSATNAVLVGYGAALPEIVPPTREGYVFAGYFSSVKGGKQYYTFDGNGKIWDRKEDATLYAQWWAEGEYRPTQVYNGDFTKMPWMDFDFKDIHWTLANYDYDFWNRDKVNVGGSIIYYGNFGPDKIYFNGVNQGWNTTERQAVLGCMFEYYCPECASTQMNPSILASDRYVEMNANNSAILYQDLTTQAGDIIRWSLKHGVRTHIATEKDQIQEIRVEIGAPLRDENGVIVNATGMGDGINPNIVVGTKAIYRSTGVTDADGNASDIGFSGSGLENLKLDKTVNLNGWWPASGVYIVPTGQSVTRFGFVSESQRPSYGNLLDDVVFSTLLGNLRLVDNGDHSATISGYWGDEDLTKRLVVEIGERILYLDMAEYVNQNFSIVLSAEQVGAEFEMFVYHEDYPSAAKTLRFSEFDTTSAYDGFAHTINTNALIAAYTDKIPGVVPSFSYSLTSNGTYSALAPDWTDVVETSLWYKVSAESFEDVIRPAKVIITNRCVTVTAPQGLDFAFGSSDAEIDVDINAAITVDGVLGTDTVTYEWIREGYVGSREAGVVYTIDFPSDNIKNVATQGNYEVAYVSGSFSFGHVRITLPTETPGYAYVVSNLTADAEAEIPAEDGGKYKLPIGAEVGIYCVADEGYDIVGTNPYVIDPVTTDTTIDASKLPKALSWKAVWARCSTAGLPAFDPKELPSGVFYYENEILFFRRTAAGAATFDFAELDAATFTGATIQFIDGEIAVESLKFDPVLGLVFVGGEGTVLKGTVDMSVFDGVAREGAGETMPGETVWTNLAFTCEASAEIVYRNGGAISIHGGDFTIAGCVFTNCFAETFGGAIFAPKLAGDSLITNCFFEGSWVSDYNGSGGAIYASATNTACTLTVVDSTFVCNMAENGGAISTVRAAEAGEVPVRLTVAACDFGGNAADFCGGAIFAEGPVTVAGAEDGGTVDAFVSNSAGFMGGAICVGGIDSESSPVVITVGEGAAFIGNTVSNDYTWAAGGAIAVLTDGCTLDVSKALFATNRVFVSADDKNAYGGAVYAPDGGTNRFYKTLFAGNELFADGCGYGGAISFATGRQTVDTCVFDCRTASAGTFVYGGALDFSSSDDVQMLNCSLRFAAVEAISAYGVGNLAVTNCVVVGNGLAGEEYDDIVCEACASVEFAYTAYGSIGGDATPTFSVTNLAACTTNIYASADSLSLNTNNYNQVAACGLVQPGVTDFTGVEYGSRPFGWSMGAYECATCDPKDAVYYIAFEGPLSVGMENYCVVSNHMTGVVKEVPVMLGGEKVEITGFNSDITVTFFVNPMYQFESNSTVTVTGVRDDVVFGGEKGIPYPATKFALIAWVSTNGGSTNAEWNATNVVDELAKRDQWTYVQFTQPVTNIYTMPDGFGFVFEKNTVFENFPSDGGLPPTLVITPPQPSDEIPEPLTFAVTRPMGGNRNVRIEGDVLFDSQLPSGEQDTLVEVTGDFACTNALQIGQLGADGRYGTPGGVSLKINGAFDCADTVTLIPGSTLVVTNGDLLGQVRTIPRCEILVDGPDADGFWTYSADYIGNVTFWDDIFTELVVSGAAVQDLWEYALQRSSEEPDYLARMLCNGETIIYGDDDGEYTFAPGTVIDFAHNDWFMSVRDGSTLVARKMDVASGMYLTLEGGTIAFEGGIDIAVSEAEEMPTTVDLFDIGVDIRCAVNVGTGTGAGWAELWLDDVDFNGGAINLGTNGMVVCTRQLAIGSEILPVGTDVKVFEEYDTFFEEYVYSLVPDGVEEHAPFEKVVIEGSAEWAEAKAECFVVRAADDEVNSFLYQKNLVAEYQKLFTFKTKPGPEDGQCTVMAVFTDAAFASISNAVVAATKEITANTFCLLSGEVLVDTQPGLWYGVRAADTLAGLKEADAKWVLGTGTKVTLTWEVKPDAANRFYRVEAWTTRP